ncbi:MAG: alpha/beta fold hydrolase [Desulfosarcina sp.]|nr:alpha/beta fold hydrolase [Desulfobacterales bacterium]
MDRPHLRTQWLPPPSPFRCLGGGLILMLVIIFPIGCRSPSAVPPQGPVFSSQRAWVDQIQAPPELRQAITRGREMRIPVAAADDIAMRVYGPAGAKTPVVMTHGLQSHSGWFAQSAVRVADQGHPVYAVDRRGSGLREATRGDMKTFDEMIDDLIVVADYISKRHGGGKIFLLGHCFGAIPAAAFAIRHPDRVEGLVLTTPAINTRTGLPFSQTLKIFFTRSGKRDYRVPSPLKPEEFTELAPYEAFIRSDPLALQAASGDFYFQVYRARQFINAHTDRLVMPIYMALAGEDPICDNPRNIRFFEKLPADDKMLVIYEDARHILEFSPEKERFLADLIFWLARETDDRE